MGLRELSFITDSLELPPGMGPLKEWYHSGGQVNVAWARPAKLKWPLCGLALSCSQRWPWSLDFVMGQELHADSTTKRIETIYTWVASATQSAPPHGCESCRGPIEWPAQAGQAARVCG